MTAGFSLSHQKKFQSFASLFNLSNKGPLPLQFEKSHFSDQTICTAYYQSSQSEPGVSIHQDPAQAAIAAMGEALERHCLLVARPEYQYISFNELQKNKVAAFDPTDFQFFSQDQFSDPNAEIGALTRSTPIDWSWFESPFHKGKCLLPAKVNSFFELKKPLYFSGSSSGGACGSSRLQAQIKAILELIERDAVMVYWWTKNTPLKIKLKKGDRDLEKALAPFKKIRPYIHLFYLKTDLPVPVVLATYKGNGKKGSPHFLVTAAADFDPLAAIQKSLSEMSQSLHNLAAHAKRLSKVKYFPDFDETVWTFQDHVALYAFTKIPKAYSFLFSKKVKSINYNQIESQSFKTEEKRFRFLTASLKKQKIRLFLRDNTTPEIQKSNLYVYRAFSPDLVAISGMHKFRHIGCPRLYTLPRKLDMPKKPRYTQDLNPYPHPFP